MYDHLLLLLTWAWSTPVTDRRSFYDRDDAILQRNLFCCTFLGQFFITCGEEVKEFSNGMMDDKRRSRAFLLLSIMAFNVHNL